MRSEIFSYLSSNSPSRNWDQLKKAFRKNYKKEEPAVINYWGGEMDKQIMKKSLVKIRMTIVKRLRLSKKPHME